MKLEQNKDSNAGYMEDVRAVEDDSYCYRLSKEAATFTISVWDEEDGIERLKAIERRHGIKPDDLRVYSIASFKAEIAAIDEEFSLGDLDSRESSMVTRRRQVRKTDCRARHFRGLIGPREIVKVKNVETPSQLWAYITFQTNILCSLNGMSQNSQRFGNRVVVDAYSALLRFGFLDCVPRVPYPELTWHESIDELTRLAVELERFESDRIRLDLEDRSKQPSRVHSSSDASTPITPPLTVDELNPVVELRKKKAPTQARLVEYMETRESATCDEIGEHVHDHKGTSENTIRQNAGRTNDSLAELDIPFRFSVCSGFVFKKKLTE